MGNGALMDAKKRSNTRNEPENKWKVVPNTLRFIYP